MSLSFADMLYKETWGGGVGGTTGPDNDDLIIIFDIIKQNADFIIAIIQKSISLVLSL